MMTDRRPRMLLALSVVILVCAAGDASARGRSASFGDYSSNARAARAPGVERAAATADPLRIQYTVAVASVEAQLFHVTTQISGINQDSLDLALPVWTPGWYTIENYYKNVLRFTATDAKGARLQPVMTRKQTWRLETRGVSSIKVDFDYRAAVLALNQAKITTDFAFFTGTELYLEPVGHRSASSTIKFQMPEGWQIVSALKETSDPM